MIVTDSTDLEELACSLHSDLHAWRCGQSEKDAFDSLTERLIRQQARGSPNKRLENTLRRTLLTAETAKIVAQHGEAEAWRRSPHDDYDLDLYLDEYLMLGKLELRAAGIANALEELTTHYEADAHTLQDEYERKQLLWQSM